MKFFVVARYMVRGKVWRSYEKEFGDIEGARYWAKQMYDCVRSERGEEVVVLLYELKESLN